MSAGRRMIVKGISGFRNSPNGSVSCFERPTRESAQGRTGSLPPCRQADVLRKPWAEAGSGRHAHLEVQAGGPWNFMGIRTRIPALIRPPSRVAFAWKLLTRLRAA
jgi:hypothetical protein